MRSKALIYRFPTHIKSFQAVGVSRSGVDFRIPAFGQYPGRIPAPVKAGIDGMCWRGSMHAPQHIFNRLERFYMRSRALNQGFRTHIKSFQTVEISRSGANCHVCQIESRTRDTGNQVIV
jgi:hypothetical protein